MSATCPDGILANADVSGIGIRVSFYVTTLLIALIPSTPYTDPLLGALFTNASINGLGLLITAIVQTAQNDLSLYHALFVQHLLFFLGVGVAPAGKYKLNSLRAGMLLVTQFAVLIAYLGWSLYLWTHTKSFGSQPGCNDQVKYVFFFVTVRATVPWLRIVWMISLIGGCIGLFTGLVVYVIVYTCFKMAATRGEHPMMTMQGAGEEQASSRSFYFSLGLLLPAVYSVVTAELLAKRNTIVQPGEGAWTFGQILSLVMIISSLNEVLHFILSLFSPRHDSDSDSGLGEVEGSPSRGRSSPKRRFLPWARTDKSNSTQLQEVS